MACLRNCFHICALSLNIEIALSQVRRPFRGLFFPGNNAGQGNLRVFFTQADNELYRIQTDPGIQRNHEGCNLFDKPKVDHVQKNQL